MRFFKNEDDAAFFQNVVRMHGAGSRDCLGQKILAKNMTDDWIEIKTTVPSRKGTIVAGM